MSKTKDYIFDFLDVVNNEMRDEYEKKHWDWDNLPTFEVMSSVMRKYNKTRNKQNEK